MKTILTRTLSGAVYIALILGSLIVNEHAFALVLLLFNLIALSEFQHFGKHKSPATLGIITSGLVFILVHLAFTNIIAMQWIWLTALSPMLIACFNLFSKENKNPISNMGFSLLALVYISLPLIILDIARIQTLQSTPWILVSMFVVIWTNDTFAYLTGLSIGKHKLFERISPKKTWEGFLGGLLFALAAGFFLHRLIEGIELIHWLVLVLFISIGSVLGDFIESLFKRSAGLKDSGNIMPGHGGILDRVDSLLFVAPIVYVYLQVIK